MAGQVAVGTLENAGAINQPRHAASGWIFNPTWDKRWLIYPALLAPVPPLIFYVSIFLLERYTAMDAATRMGAAEDIVSLFVMVLIGGPHVWVTFTRTWLHPEFRAREKAWYWASFSIVPIVAIMALSSELTRTLLLTGFFFIASLHIIHQLSYVVRFYQDRDAAKPSLKSRLIDVGAILFPLYPMASFRMVMTNESSMAYAWASQWFGSSVDSWKFSIGRVQPMLPEFILSDWFWMANLMGFLFFTSLWARKSMREHRAGILHKPKFMLICAAIGVGLFCPLLPNLDSSFQGFNLWHSIQYVALTWFIMRVQVKRGNRLNPFVRWLTAHDNTGKRYYGVAMLIVGVLIALMIGIATILAAAQGIGMFAGGGEAGTLTYKPGAILQAYYLFGFGLLLTHYFHDAFFFNMHTFNKSSANTRL